jgi:hypothetical protein
MHINIEDVKMQKICYECEELVSYLFGDGRCKKCTRLTREEI